MDNYNDNEIGKNKIFEDTRDKVDLSSVCP